MIKVLKLVVGEGRGGLICILEIYQEAIILLQLFLYEITRVDVELILQL